MKKCSTCKQFKELFEFNKKTANKDGYERYCKDCHRKFNRNHYLNNPEPYKAQAKKSKQNLMEWYHTYKSTLICSKCGETKPWRLSFHHINKETKEYTISMMARQNRNREKIMKEIAKCIVVCHNCHADIHHEEGKEI